MFLRHYFSEHDAGGHAFYSLFAKMHTKII